MFYSRSRFILTVFSIQLLFLHAPQQPKKAIKNIRIPKPRINPGAIKNSDTGSLSVSNCPTLAIITEPIAISAIATACNIKKYYSYRFW